MRGGLVLRGLFARSLQPRVPPNDSQGVEPVGSIVVGRMTDFGAERKLGGDVGSFRFAPIAVIRPA
jgi:hypothetical protein